MGDIADQLINDIMFGEYDEIGECFQSDYSPRGNKKPKGLYRKTAYIHLTPSERKIASIRKEIAIAVSEGININDARKQANIKHGHGWRERGLTNNPNSQWTEECLAPFTSKRNRNKKQSLSLKNL